MEKTIQLGDLSLTLQYNEETNQPFIHIDKADVRVNDPRLLALMNEANDYFVYQEITEHEDYYIFEYDITDNDTTWDQASALYYHDQLRLLINANRLSETLHGRLNVVLHPNNLIYDDNLLPYALYRGFAGSIEPTTMSEEIYLKQYKCLIIATIGKKYDFDQLFEGCLPLAKENNLIRDIANAASLSIVLALLQDAYETEKKRVDETMKLIPQKRHTHFVRLTAIFAVLLVILAIPLLYMSVVMVPYQSNLLTANEAYLSNDYELVIAKLGTQDANGLPQASKYELAYAYLQGEALSQEQLTNIMSNLSLKSDERVLLYWIYNGQGKYAESLDIAKALGDEQLIIYGIYKNIEAVNNNKSLSGTEKETQLKELNSSLEEHKKSFLGNETQTTENTTTESATNE
ncbi:type VII secretion protein EssB [Listeria weihenstephanensis]|uniref:Type VII secretion protein EssB n=1 Tax=Listeria weihenstephanensis TaxID=1006155 RepID=A0A841ZC76_9LIST|nr:type VII secretion protein EssB [Listeria weihenstephanensis]MBC1502116.1 type VII secretion protein EssB [Listeria weihenstephanensis]